MHNIIKLQIRSVPGENSGIVSSLWCINYFIVHLCFLHTPPAGGLLRISLRGSQSGYNKKMKFMSECLLVQCGPRDV